MPEAISPGQEDAEVWGLAWLVTLPNLGPVTSHARVAWCESRWGRSWQGLWNYWDFDRQYLFHRLEDAVLFELTWG